jgi:hypothetical protein
VLGLPLFSHSRRYSAAEGTQNNEQLRKAIRKAKAIDIASELLLAALVEKIALCMSTTAENISVSKPMSD